jgi:prepilin-type N-terminal cleavage/methylation domain-containing protein
VSATRRSPGFTLVELAVALVILTFSALLASAAFRSILEGGGSTEETRAARLRNAQREAVLTGRPVVLWPDTVADASPILFLPDCRAVGAGVDPLTGRDAGGP